MGLRKRKKIALVGAFVAEDPTISDIQFVQSSDLLEIYYVKDGKLYYTSTYVPGELLNEDEPLPMKDEFKYMKDSSGKWGFHKTGNQVPDKDAEYFSKKLLSLKNNSRQWTSMKDILG